MQFSKNVIVLQYNSTDIPHLLSLSQRDRQTDRQMEIIQAKPTGQSGIKFTSDPFTILIWSLFFRQTDKVSFFLPSFLSFFLLFAHVDLLLLVVIMTEYFLCILSLTPVIHAKDRRRLTSYP